MKKVSLLFIAIIIAMQSWSQTTLNESFEGITFPPENWTTQNTRGPLNSTGSPTIWTRYTGYSHTGSASASVEYNSSGTTNYLITPKLTVNATNSQISFWAMMSTLSSTYNQTFLRVLVSTTTNNYASFDTISLLTLSPSFSGINQITASWNQWTVDLSSYIGQNIYIAFKQDDDDGYRLCLDDIMGPELFVPTCPKPTALLASNPTTIGVDLGWTDATGSLWNIQYMLATETDWTNSTTITGVNNPYTFTNLNSSTEYKVRVQTDCGTEQSEWSTPISFGTQCGAITTFPYVEGFESDWTLTTLPGNSASPYCWININGYDSSYYWERATYYTGVHTGSGSAYQNFGSGSASSNSDWLISPIFTLDGNKKLNFYTMAIYLPLEISVYLLDVTTNGDILSASDTSNFIRIMGPELQTTSWLFHELSLPYTGDYRIAFVRNSVSGEVIYLDDISISEMPLCPNTYNLISSLHSATEVDLNWMQNGNGNGWVIAYGDTTAFDPATATQTITISSTDPVPYTVNGLTPQTPYSFAVRQNCTDGAWSNIVSVTTPAIAATLPYAHNFEDSTENRSWKFINGTQTNQWFIGSAADTLGANGLYISNDQGVTNQYSGGYAYVSKVYAYRDFEVPVGAGELELSFDWRAQGGVGTSDFLRMYLVPIYANIEAGAIPNDLDASAQIGNYTGGNGYHWLSQSAIWQHKTMRINSLQFPNLAGRTWRLLVYWKNESPTTTGNQPPAAVDNIRLTVVTCPRPSALAASNITTTSALLTWQENGSATDWIIEYKPSYSNTWTKYQTTSNPDSIIGLLPSTVYSVRLRSLCSDTSLYSNTITFQTVCGAISVPTPVEGFLTTVPPTTCWSRMQGTLPATGTATLTTTTSGWDWNSNVTSHNAKLEIYTSLFSTSSTNYWLISPSVDLGDGSIHAQIEFDVFFTAHASTNAADASGTDDRFAVVVSTDDGLTWDAANARIWSNESGATRVLNNIPNTPTHIILPLFDPATTLPYAGNIKVGFYGESTASNADNDIHIDNFEVLPYSTCQRPTSVSASNITSSGATVSFTGNGESTTWEYVYGDATTITDPTTETAISTTNNPFQLTGLTSQTQYNVWVRSVCNNGSSDWSVLCTFVTEALPAAFPYTCDFEDSTENLAWKSLSNGINKWTMGTAAGNGNTSTGTQANYISNDNGVSYDMNSNSTYSYTYRDIDFGTDPASYNLSFDWKCHGYIYNNTLYAGLRVYLVNPSETIDPSSLSININDSLGTLYNALTWQTAHLPIDNVSGVKRLIFVYFDQTYYYAPPAAIDNISLVQATCPRPANVTISNLTPTTADITWTEVGSANTWYVFYKKATEVYYDSVFVNTNSHTFLQLDASTLYDVYVVSNCGNEYSNSSQVVNFRTTCATISTLPWSESFDTYGTGSSIYIQCWSKINTYSSNRPYITSINHSAPGSLYFFAGSGTYNVAATPQFDLSISINTLKAKFWMRKQSANTNLIVGVMTDPLDLTTFDSITTVSPTTTLTWEEFEVNFSSYTGNGLYIAFKSVYNTANNYFYIDDLVIDFITTCAAPTNVTVPTATITNNSAIVNWTAGDQETAWQVSLDLTGTPIDVNTNSYQFTTGLTPGTNYTVYVRANCGTSFSQWVPQTFTTASEYQLPTVTTTAQTNTNQTSTTLNGSYLQGTNPILVKGFEWKESSASSWTIVPVSAGTTPFVYALNGLTANTSYDFRAYVETSQDTTRGITVTFSTLANVLPNVTTAIPNPIGQTTAAFSGTTAQGTESIQIRGFEYKLTSTTTWTGAIDVTATGTTTITANATDLIPNTQYDVRAYAQTLSDGRTYGNIITFTTLENIPPTITTTAVTNITQTTATFNGTTAQGSESIQARGFEYKQTSTDTWTGAIDVTATGTTTIMADVTGLLANTEYDVRAYAQTQTDDRTYGNIETFRTDSVSGLSDMETNHFLVSMYPNPTTNTTKLVVSGVEGETDIIINDVQGKLIYQTTAKAVNGKVEKTIDVNSFAKGVYYVRIQNQTTSRTQKLIVIN